MWAGAKQVLEMREVWQGTLERLVVFTLLCLTCDFYEELVQVLQSMHTILALNEDLQSLKRERANKRMAHGAKQTQTWRQQPPGATKGDRAH